MGYPGLSSASETVSRAVLIEQHSVQSRTDVFSRVQHKPSHTILKMYSNYIHIPDLQLDDRHIGCFSVINSQCSDGHDRTMDLECMALGLWVIDSPVAM